MERLCIKNCPEIVKPLPMYTCRRYGSEIGDHQGELIRHPDCNAGSERCYIEYDIKNIPYQFYSAIQMATKEANRILNTPIFLDLIKSHVENYAHSFDNDGGVNGAEIVQMIEKYPRAYEIDKRFTGKCHIVGYKSKWPWSKVLAYTTRKKPEIIFLNVRNMARSVRELMATLIHEFIHILDQLFNPQRFGHRGNSPLGNKRSAPRWIARLAMDF